MRRNVFVFCLLALYANTINARQLDIQPGEDIKTAIENLVAGDTLWVKTGTYEVSSPIPVTIPPNSFVVFYRTPMPTIGTGVTSISQRVPIVV